MTVLGICDSHEAAACLFVGGRLIAAIHPADFTVCPQILRQAANPHYYKLIQEFEALTGVGAVLNTSLNLHGEPVVCSPEDALRTFENSELDALVFDDFLVLREA